jgi:hypothetical protein
MVKHQCVGWQSCRAANAFGGVPTTRREDIRFRKMVGTAQMCLCSPYELPHVALFMRAALAKACMVIPTDRNLTQVIQNMPSKSVKSFADQLVAELDVMGLSDDERVFVEDPLGGSCRTLGRWNVQRGCALSICVYEDSYFGGSRNCWVGFGAKDSLSVEAVKGNSAEESFVELRPKDWTIKWELANSDKKAALKRTSFTVYEDWRPRGWVWFGRYFRDDQARQAIAFLREVIYAPRSDSHSSNNSRKTEGVTESKTRLGQGDFRSKVIELWGRRCALTGCRVVPVLEAAHIDSWAKNRKDRLAPENGLSLLPTVHRLFEVGFISFGDDSCLLTKLSRDDLRSLGLRDDMRLSKFLTQRQKISMKEHRRRHGFKDPAGAL